MPKLLDKPHSRSPPGRERGWQRETHATVSTGRLESDALEVELPGDSSWAKIAVIFFPAARYHARMNITIIIAAAGVSRRFGEQDKLAQDLGGRALLLRTVEQFTKREEVGSIIVAGPPEDFDAFKEKFAATLGFHGAKVVKGGSVDRWETVRNALAEISDDTTHVGVHDAARPGVSDKLLDRVFAAARTLPAVIPAVDVAGTVKRVSADVTEVNEDEDAVADLILGESSRATIATRTVEQTVDRSNLVEVQTPQVFEIGLLRRAYAQDDLTGATDDASLVERLGEPVHVVEGDSANLKVTTPADLVLMRAILGVKPPAERPTHKRF